jgi:excinuclease UvrABC ATPase subunit
MEACVMRIQIDEGSVTLTPFGSLIRTNPTGVSGSGKSSIAKFRALLALLFRRLFSIC